MSRKVLACCVIPVCLFLITLGIRIPNLANQHAAPKQRPRAVVESTCKKNTCRSVQDAATAKILPVEICSALPELLPPRSVRTCFSRHIYSFQCITLPPSGARAPPFLTS